MCKRAIASNKNFRLTDYLRADTEEARAKARIGILRMDAYFDEVEKVNVISTTCLMGSPFTARSKGTQRDVNMQKATILLEFEAEQGLMMHFLAMANLVDQLDGDVEEKQQTS